MHTDMVYHVFTNINVHAEPDMKTRQKPLGKNSGTCSPNHAAAINFWSLEACK